MQRKRARSSPVENGQVASGGGGGGQVASGGGGGGQVARLNGQQTGEDVGGYKHMGDLAAMQQRSVSTHLMI